MKRWFAAAWLEFVEDERGASASEYAVLVAVIIVAIFAAVKLFSLGNIYEVVASKVQSCVDGSC